MGAPMNVTTVPQIAPNTPVNVHFPDFTREQGFELRRGRVQFLHNDAFEQGYSWRHGTYRFCVMLDDEVGREVRQWVDSRWLYCL